MLRVWGNSTALQELENDFTNDGSQEDVQARRSPAYIYGDRYVYPIALQSQPFSRQAAKSWPSDPLPWTKSVTKTHYLYLLPIKPGNPIADEEESRNNDNSEEVFTLRPLSEPGSWPSWLEMLENSMINESQTMLFSTYIYCKKQALDGSASQDD